MGVPATALPWSEAPSSRAWARSLVACAGALFLVAVVGLLFRFEPFASWFFVFAWWSYIFALDGLTYLRRQSSILLTRPRGFALLLPWSSAFWLLFELANLRLGNWYYVGLPASTLSRHIGIFVSFATVLPAIFETADFMSTFDCFEKARSNPQRWRVTESRRHVLTVLGVVCAVLPLAFPRYAFPLIWGATFCLLEPWLVARNQRSLWGCLAAGRPAPVLRIFAAGAICGLCWESWNFWASAKWIYTVPFFEEWKLFEMPLLGFLGFPPFALECYTFARVLVATGVVSEWETELPRRVVSRRRQTTWALGITALCVPAVFAVDRWIVRSTAVQIGELAALTPAHVEDLQELGIAGPRDLRAVLENWQHGDALDEETLQAVAAELELAETALMGRRGVAWLASIGVTTVTELGLADTHFMQSQLRQIGRGPLPEPSAAEIRVWSRKARAQLAAR